MARTREEIAQEMQAGLTGTPLSGVSDASAAGVWRTLRDVVAHAHVSQEQVFEAHLAEVQELADAAISGTDDWLVAQAKYWQNGNNTLDVSSDKRLRYVVEQPANALIKWAAVTPFRATALLKVAKDDGSGLPAPLSTEELAHFRGFVGQIQLVGTKITVRSVASDLMRVTGSIYYDARYVQTEVSAAVGEAIQAYLKVLPVNGRVLRQKVEAAVLAVPGVTDVKLGLQAKRSGGPGYNDFMDGGRFYDAYAGHVRWAEGDSTITYLADNV